MTRTLIKGATVVLPEETRVADVVLEDDNTGSGKIVDIDPSGPTSADETINAEGLHLIPGVIDDQVHFREPGFEHKEDLATASRACAKGGVTTFLEMPNTNPNTTSLDALHAKLDLAASKSIVNFGFYIGATPDNIDQLKLAKRTPGIKVFIGSSTGNLLVDRQEALEHIFAETTLPITAHCEDEATIRANAERFAGTTDVADHSRIRDHKAAVIATRRAIDLAKRHNHRFHVLHVSTADEIPLIADHGNLITAEVCPHHLFFNVDDYQRLGTLIQMNPSVKTKADNRQLWQAIVDNTIQVVATDHAPHTLEEKRQPYPKSPSGLPAVENSLALMLNQVHQGNCTIEQVVGWMCDAPARVWDIVDKGRIQIGFDADVVLVDLNLSKAVRNERQFTKSKWSPWDGETLTGWAVGTWVRGNRVFASENEDDERITSQALAREVQFDHTRSGYWGK
ncbi:MAG: dihydroorotase [Planctomycetales bacterium]|nr:dihydroorotase [Planctomycetales bacterium]